MSNDLTEVDGPGPDADARICTASDIAAQYKRHHLNLHRVANQVFDGKRPDAAEDAVMTVITHLLDLVEDKKLTDKGDMWGPYLRRAVRNSCIDILRAEKKGRERFPGGDPDDVRVINFDPLGDTVAADDETRRRRALVAGAVASLSDRHAAIIKHTFWDRWSNKQIGETLGITPQAVGQQLKTALKRLHDEVTRND